MNETMQKSSWTRFWYKASYKFPSLWKVRNLMAYGKINPNTRAEWEKEWKDCPPEMLEENYPVLFNAIISHIKPGDRVLDIGCGNGLLLLKIKEAIPGIARLAGIDLSSNAIEYLKKNNIEGKQASLPDIPYAAGEFNTFISTETLEHISHPEKTIRKVYALGANKIIFSVPNYMPPHYTPLHVQGWTQQSFEKFLAENLPGFQLVSSRIVQEKGHRASEEGNGHILIHMEKS